MILIYKEFYFILFFLKIFMKNLGVDEVTKETKMIFY